jgi:hypothetical protein
MSFRTRNVKRKDTPAACPFCEKRVPRPADLGTVGGASEAAEGGHCSCGAIYIADVTGKNGGQALVDGLTLLADGDQDRGMELSVDMDYEMQKLGYNPRTHSLEKSALRKGGGFGQAKLFFFRLLDAAASS